MPRRPIRIVEKKLGRERALGMSILSDMEIHIDPRQKPKDFLDTVVHESLHLLEPDWSEEKVIAGAKHLTNILWAMGFRRTHL